MKRKLTVQSGNRNVRISVTATIATTFMTREQVNDIAQEVGDRLMLALQHIPWAQTRLSKMRVK